MENCDPADCCPEVENQGHVELPREEIPEDLRRKALMLSSMYPPKSYAAGKEIFSSGAVRDTQEGKLLYGEICPYFKKRVAKVLTDGAVKYSRGNWKKGMNFQRVVDSLLRHLESYLLGDRAEDNLAMIVVNTMFLIHYEEMIRQGRLPKELDDLEGHETRWN